MKGGEISQAKKKKKKRRKGAELIEIQNMIAKTNPSI